MTTSPPKQPDKARQQRLVGAAFKSQVIEEFYGIHPESLDIERVSLTKGRTLIRWRNAATPIVYRIKHGRPAKGEIERVFRLEAIISCRRDDGLGHGDDTALERLHGLAAEMRCLRKAAQGESPPENADKVIV